MSEWRKSVRRISIALLVLYVLVCICGCAFQRRLIYFPTELATSVAEQMAVRNGLSAWRNETGQIIGWKITASGVSAGSVLVIHGNAGCAIDRSYFAKPIHDAMPLDVYVLEYPGYGTRAGSPTMGSILAATEEAFTRLPEDKAVYLVSESIGAGSVAHLAKLHPEKVKGMAMFVPYDDFASVAQQAMPFLPVRLILLDCYQPALWLKDYRGPIKFVLAGADEVIPTKFGQRLFDSYHGPKQLQIFPGARHNEVAGQPPEWWKEVLSFWQQLRR